uniref:Uncharacterized protein n=1 Tax=Aeromonas hydrophila TaxID=644 RepID=Q5VI43_AERHY|nr:unknown [Aeromonas hydrophila]
MALSLAPFLFLDPPFLAATLSEAWCSRTCLGMLARLIPETGSSSIGALQGWLIR